MRDKTIHKGHYNPSLTRKMVMITNQARRLAIMRGWEVIGIIREQDLFFEIERILRE